MPHFLIDQNCIENNLVRVSNKETAAHLAGSLRIRPGEKIKFIDKEETVYFTEIKTVSKGEIVAEIIRREKSTRKLGFDLCALICVLKPEAMHLAVENAVQLGAKEIYTVYSDNSAVNKNSVLNKTEKWQKIGMESFKQCERADIPKVFEVAPFEETFKKFKKENILIFAERHENFNLKEALETVDFKGKILAVFGPEGGFSEGEFEYFKKENLKLVTLGKLILKAPNAVTAGLFGISQNA